MSRLFLRVAIGFFNFSQNLLDKASREAALEIEAADKVVDAANRVRSEAVDRRAKADKFSAKLKELLA